MRDQLFDLLEVLRFVVREEGSDLHLKVGSRPLARVHGRLAPIEQYDQLQAADTERVLRVMLTDPVKLAEFDSEHEVDLSYAAEGLARFRVNGSRPEPTSGLGRWATPAVPFWPAARFSS